MTPASPGPPVPGLPVLGLAVAGGPVDALLPLLGRLSRWCDPRLLDDAPAPPVAALASDPRARVPAGLPLAVHVRRPEDLETGCAPAAVRVLTTDEAVLTAAGPRGAWLPDAPLPPGTRHVPPWVRVRLRAARGLPAQPLLVLRGGVPHWAPGPGPDPSTPVDEAHLATALATASAAALSGPGLAVLALAWGTPLVTDARTCALVGAVDGESVLVVGDGDTGGGAPAGDGTGGTGGTDGTDGERARAAAAAALAADPARCAALSRAGRALAERRHDLAGTAAALARALLPVQGGDRAGAALDELGTPAGARVRARTDEALAALLTDPSRRTP